jgi:hypothetical protein
MVGQGGGGSGGAARWDQGRTKEEEKGRRLGGERFDAVPPFYS